MLEGVAYALQPLVHILFVLDALVGPVGGVAVLSLGVHTLGPDLDFDAGSLPVGDGDVEGLVAVGLRIGKPVAQALCVRDILLGHV